MPDTRKGSVKLLANHDLSCLRVRTFCAEQLLMEAGLDSLASVEFRNRVQSELGESIALPETLVFDFPTIRSLVKHIDAEIASSAAPAQAHCPPLWLATTFACVAYGLVMRREAGVVQLAMSRHGHRISQSEADVLKLPVTCDGHRLRSPATFRLVAAAAPPSSPPPPCPRPSPPLPSVKPGSLPVTRWSGTHPRRPADRASHALAH